MSTIESTPAALERRGGFSWAEASLVGMVTIWGLNFAVAKRALATFDPLVFNALRYLVASGFYFAALRSRGALRMPAREDWGRIVLLGFLGNAVYQFCFIVGLDLTTAGSGSLILAVMPVFVLMMDVWGGERHGPRAWVGAGGSVVGVALVSRAALHFAGAGALLGNLLMLLAAALWAVYTQGSKPLIARYGAVNATAWPLWAGAVFVVLSGIPGMARQDWGAVDLAGWGGLIYSGFLSIGLAYLLWYRSVGSIGGSRTAIYSNLTPLVAMIAGAVWLREAVTPSSLLGAAMIIGGVMLVRE